MSANQAEKDSPTDLHLLLVEDNPDVTDALRILFEHNGYRVSCAANVADAVQIGIDDPPQLVLLDISLANGEDGLAILYQWRERGVKVPRVMAVTGHSDDGTRERCAAAGCEALMVKPVPSSQLLASIRALHG